MRAQSPNHWTSRKFRLGYKQCPSDDHQPRRPGCSSPVTPNRRSQPSDHPLPQAAKLADNVLIPQMLAFGGCPSCFHLTARFM